jgi:hypothetical protein
MTQEQRGGPRVSIKESDTLVLRRIKCKRNYLIGGQGVARAGMCKAVLSTYAVLVVL